MVGKISAVNLITNLLNCIYNKPVVSGLSILWLQQMKNKRDFKPLFQQCDNLLHPYKGVSYFMVTNWCP